MNQILGADHEAMITLKGLQYSPTHADLYVDVWWLTRGLSVSDIQYLRGIQNSQAEHFCCYKEGGVGPVNKMMSGYARVIMYSDKHGIETLEQGARHDGASFIHPFKGWLEGCAVVKLREICTDIRFRDVRASINKDMGEQRHMELQPVSYLQAPVTHHARIQSDTGAV